MKANSLYLFTPGFAAGEGDTTCIPFLQQFCLSFKEMNPGVQLVIFAFQYPAQSGEYKWNGIPVISFGGNNIKGVRRILLWWRVSARFFSMQEEFKPIGIFSIWLTECAFVGKFLSALFGIKHFTWIVGQDARKTNRYVKYIRPDENNLVAFSTFIQRQMHDNFGKTPYSIIRNGVDPGAFEKLKEEGRSIAVMGAGSLITLKNFNLFVEVMVETKKRVLINRVVLAGEGPERENIEKLIVEKDLKLIVELKGSIEHKELLRLMNESRIFLHTSEYDSNASVLHEALHAGCKVVSTSPIDPEPKDNFYLLKDKNAIVEKVVELLSEENKGHVRITVNTMNNSAKQVMELFE